MHRNNEISLESRLPVLFVHCCGKKKDFYVLLEKDILVLEMSVYLLMWVR